MSPNETLKVLQKRLKEEKHSPSEEFFIRQNIEFWKNEIKKINELNVYNFTIL
jgi:hypothetical protein